MSANPTSSMVRRFTLLMSTMPTDTPSTLNRPLAVLAMTAAFAEKPAQGRMVRTGWGDCRVAHSGPPSSRARASYRGQTQGSSGAAIAGWSADRPPLGLA